MVGSHDVKIWEDRRGWLHVRNLPPWARAFVAGIDSLREVIEIDRVITRAEAFEILDLVDAGAWGPDDAA